MISRLPLPFDHRRTPLAEVMQTRRLAFAAITAAGVVLLIQIAAVLA
jgi:hypothetical protein